MSTFLWQNIVFGPIHSRRLGTSLGINLMPVNGKICSFDCIYCECGWNRDGHGNAMLPGVVTLRGALEEKLREMKESNVVPDTITFSGNGEPTIHPDFPQIIDVTLKLRDSFFPEAKVSVLSNATMLHDVKVRNALMKVDNPILKLDGVSDLFVKKINNPAPSYSVRTVIDEMMKLEGRFVLQAMFLRGEINGERIDSTMPENSGPWIETVLKLRPREVMMYTIDRETPMSGLEKISVEEMEHLASPLREAGINVQIRG